MKIVFATNNQNKVKEVQAQIGGEITVESLKSIDCSEEIPEDSDTIEGNAIQKAMYVWENYGVNCFADDTGLVINALNGEPGVFSARYAGEQKSSENNMDLVLSKLEEKHDRSAHFQTTIGLVINGKLEKFTGIAKGEIRKEKSGTEGFGYDPIFEPEGFNVTFSEMSTEEKNQISHRGKAVKQLIDFLNKI